MSVRVWVMRWVGWGECFHTEENPLVEEATRDPKRLKRPHMGIYQAIRRKSLPLPIPLSQQESYEGSVEGGFLVKAKCQPPGEGPVLDPLKGPQSVSASPVIS